MYNQGCADWVQEVISKMADDEAQVFATLVVHDVWHSDMEKNKRTLIRKSAQLDAEMRDEVAEMLLEHLNAGYDPEEAVAMAAAVGLVSKDGSEHWKYQERNHGRFGRMTRSEYRAQRKAIKAENRADFYRQSAALKGKRLSGSEYGNVKHNQRNTGEAVGRLEEGWNRRNSGDSTTSNTFQRVEAGGKLVQELGVASGKPSVAIAGATARYAGQFGPEAEKVIGPSMRKAAYRYRGTEKTPDPKLMGAAEASAVAYLREEGREKGTNRQVVTNSKGERKIVEVPRKNALEALSPEEKTYATQRAAIAYFVQGDRIPKSNLSALHRASGKVTPSEGVIIDSKGQVSHQAVGFAEDHYLPFNMKNLADLQGGSYVRTRESGGLTTEDIYTGLMTGARSMTVVSNSGVFTVNFDDTLRGGRRYGDKAKQMVDRYAHTLDAVKSKTVDKTPMTAREKAEIRVEMEDEFEANGLAALPDAEKEELISARIQQVKDKPRLDPEEMNDLKRRANAHSDNPKEARIHFNELYDEAMSKKQNRSYQLDGEGYSVALDALKEQFPYFIDEVEYHTKAGAKGNVRSDVKRFNTGTDSGYVKPRHLNPDDAKSGYFDASITGSGKAPASQTNYQNWQNNPRRKGTSTTEAPEAAGEAPKKPATVADKVKQVNETTEADKKNKALKDATKQEAAWWVNTNKASGDGQGLDPTKHAAIIEFGEADDEGKEAILNDPSKAARLRAATKSAKADFGDSIKGGTVPSYVENALKSQERPKMTDASLDAPEAPEVPLAIDDGAAETARKRQEVQALLGVDDEKLVRLSNVNRQKMAEFKKMGNTESSQYKMHRTAVQTIETARALKHQTAEVDEDEYNVLQAAAKTTEETKPAPTAVETKVEEPKAEADLGRVQSALKQMIDNTKSPNDPNVYSFKAIHKAISAFRVGEMDRSDFEDEMYTQIDSLEGTWQTAQKRRLLKQILGDDADDQYIR